MQLIWKKCLEPILVKFNSMSRIQELFGKKSRKILNVYCTAGFPQLNNTMEVLHALQEGGADMVEIGMPYSDPLADGPVIQESSQKAIANGMSIPELFRQLKSLRKEISIPVILMGYMNPVMQYGFGKFCKEAAELGIDGLIIPDLPWQEFESEYSSILKEFGLDFIFLVTPETSPERVKILDQLSSGFLYAVSSSSTTGSNTGMTGVKDYLERLQQLPLKNPVLVGFGIQDKESFEEACRYANGGIIGTAYIKAIGQSTDLKADTAGFLSQILS